VEPQAAHEIVRAFLATDFEGGRHAQRVDQIRELEGTA
jgi:ribose 5-phosphate isomerase RpiB